MPITPTEKAITLMEKAIIPIDRVTIPIEIATTPIEKAIHPIEKAIIPIDKCCSINSPNSRAKKAKRGWLSEPSRSAQGRAPEARRRSIRG